MDNLFSLIFQNQIVSGGLVLMLSGAVMALLRKVPGLAWSHLKRQFLVSVEVASEDQAFHWLKVWLDAQPYSKKSRSLSVSVDYANDSSEMQQSMPSAERENARRPRLLFTPAPGLHFFWHERRFFWMYRNRETHPNNGNSPSSRNNTPRETITLNTVGRSASHARSLLYRAMEFALPPVDNRVRVRTCVYGCWREVSRIKPRPLDSVILPNGQLERLLADVERFLKSEETYRSIGVPYRRGYLLYGLPGAGKTSSIVALAGHLRMDLYILNLASYGMDDERLSGLLLDAPPDALLLLEDIDCVFVDRKKTKDSGEGRVTFSGLLNALDGAIAREGRVLFITTNHVEKLDDALVRPGRVDHKIEFGYATVEQIARMYQRFHPEDTSLDAKLYAESFGGLRMTMAEVQQMLLSDNKPKAQKLAAAGD